jgi:glucose/arabinose dehydrogenase
MTPTGPVTVTGKEHLTWDQSASSSAELSTIGFKIYIDGAPSGLTGVVCTTPPSGTAGAAAGLFECKAPLPPMTAGDHSLELTSFFQDGPTVESAKAGPLLVTVVGATTMAPQQPGQAAAPSETPSGRRAAAGEAASGTGARTWPPAAVRVADGLDRPADLAFTPDARLWIAERSGRVRVLQDGAVLIEPALTLAAPAGGGGAIVALAVDPQFARTHFIFAIYTARSRHPGVGGAGGPRSGPLTFTLARFREAANTLADRIVILDDVPASLEPRAALRFGPDGKLYAAFDDGGDDQLIGDLASFNGKILRLNPDGTTPDDAARKSPVFMSGITSPRGLAWHRRSGQLWAADEQRVGTVPWDNAPAALAILEDDLFVGSDVGLMRGRIDEQHPSRLTGTADVLRNVPVHAVAAGPDGALYFATDDALGRLQE